MIVNSQTRIYGVNGLTQEDLSNVKTFLQGAVYTWVKNRRGEWFSIRDLMGGTNFSWKDTPLQSLYDKHIAWGKDHESAIKSAGKDAGKLLKRVLQDDNRQFETRKAFFTTEYKWIE